MKQKKYPVGIYDNMFTGISVRIIEYNKIGSVYLVTLQFTRNPYGYNKSYFQINAKDLKQFLKGFIKRN